MSMNNFTGFKAGGTIAPSRFVIIDAAADNQVLEAGNATGPVYTQTYGTSVAPLIGISQVGMKRTPGLAGSDVTVAAANGDVIQLFGLGDVCALQLAGTVVRGDLLVTDVAGGTGKGLALTTTPNATFQAKSVGARALQSGVIGQLILVQIVQFYV